jgi:hypothetical protein
MRVSWGISVFYGMSIWYQGSCYGDITSWLAFVFTCWALAPCFSSGVVVSHTSPFLRPCPMHGASACPLSLRYHTPDGREEMRCAGFAIGDMSHVKRDARAGCCLALRASSLPLSTPPIPDQSQTAFDTLRPDNRIHLHHRMKRTLFRSYLESLSTSSTYLYWANHVT